MTWNLNGVIEFETSTIRQESRLLMIEFVRKLPAPIGLLALSAVVGAHHSTSAFYDRSRTAEVEGTVTNLFLRNPHIGITLLVETETGEQQEWQIEGGTYNDLRRRNFDESTIAVGTRIRVVGAASRRGENEIYLRQLFAPDGEVLMRAGLGTRSGSIEPDPEAEAAARGIFRVWVNGGRIHGLRNPLSLTPAALAAKADWDPVTDDPSLRCQAPGMPNANLNPYPIEFVDEGDRIVLRIEEWDAVRTIHLNGEVPADAEPTPLGYSVARWEGKTLVIETSLVDYHLLDDSGTPMSGEVGILERYTLTDDDTRLDYEVIVTDPQYLAEPAVWDAVWAWDSGVQIQPFECTVR